MAGKRQITDISSNQPPAKRSHTSFNLLEVDLIEINRDHVNEIILLNRSRVPDGNPTGIISEIMTQKNYPNLQLNELDHHVLPFLIRSCAVSIVNEFREMKTMFDDDNYFPAKGKIFQGPAGAGKSYVLYHVVQFCRASGWLVLYIPTAGAFNEYDNERAAGSILDNFLHAEKDKLKEIEYDKIVHQSLHDFIQSGLRERKYFETWKGLSNLFRIKRLKYPFLIAVDEWNVKFDNPRCQELFEFFGVQKLNSGFWLYAVSSSFNPVKDVFQNADRQTLSVTIPRYTGAETNIILSCQKHFKRLPQNIDDKKIQYHSGFMPRMIFFWCEAWRGNLEKQFGLILQEYNTAAESYYTERIVKTLTRADGSRQERSQIYDIAAQVCLNIPVWSLPELWKISGLFVEVQRERVKEFACVCPPVSNAFMKNLSDQTSNIISVMATDEITKSRAFELLVTFRFHTYSKTVIELPNKDLCRNLRDPSNLHVIINRVVRQTSLLDDPLEPGTLIICLRGHRVIDLVVYSENLDLYFIQISLQPYREHDKKVSNLSDSFRDKTVLAYYMDLCQNDDKSRRFKEVTKDDLDNVAEKLPEGVYYVYISMSGSVMRSTTGGSGHPVVSVILDDLDKALGGPWVSHKPLLLANRS